MADKRLAGHAPLIGTYLLSSSIILMMILPKLRDSYCFIVIIHILKPIILIQYCNDFNDIYFIFFSWYCIQIRNSSPGLDYYFVLLRASSSNHISSSSSNLIDYLF